MKETVEKVIREDLRGSGLNVKYYSWSRINFNKGFKHINSNSFVKIPFLTIKLIFFE